MFLQYDATQTVSRNLLTKVQASQYTPNSKRYNCVDTSRLMLGIKQKKNKQSAINTPFIIISGLVRRSSLPLDAVSSGHPHLSLLSLPCASPGSHNDLAVARRTVRDLGEGINSAREIHAR